MSLLDRISTARLLTPNPTRTGAQYVWRSHFEASLIGPELFFPGNSRRIALLCSVNNASTVAFTNKDSNATADVLWVVDGIDTLQLYFSNYGPLLWEPVYAHAGIGSPNVTVIEVVDNSNR